MLIYAVALCSSCKESLQLDHCDSMHCTSASQVCSTLAHSGSQSFVARVTVPSAQLICSSMMHFHSLLHCNTTSWAGVLCVCQNSDQIMPLATKLYSWGS